MKKYAILFSFFFYFLHVYHNTVSAYPIIGRGFGLYTEVKSGTAVFDLKHLDTHAGYYVGGAIGCHLPFHFKVEAEVLYSHARLKKIKEKGIELNHLGGHISSVSYMTNVLYELDLCFVLHPFVGVGVGYIQSHEKWAYHRPIRRQSFYFEELHKHESKPDGFAWQFLAGLTFPIYPSLEAGFNYRLQQQESKGTIHQLGLSLGYIF